MAELVDAADSKSAVRKNVLVRFQSRALDLKIKASHCQEAFHKPKNEKSPLLNYLLPLLARSFSSIAIYFFASALSESIFKISSK